MLLYSLKNIIRNLAKAIVDICIGITKDEISVFPKKLITKNVLLLMKFLVVLTSVQFNYYFSRSDIKVHDIWSKNFLTMHGNREQFKTVIPQMPLFLGHGFSKVSSV